MPYSLAISLAVCGNKKLSIFLFINFIHQTLGVVLLFSILTSSSLSSAHVSISSLISTSFSLLLIQGYIFLACLDAYLSLVVRNHKQDINIGILSNLICKLVALFDATSMSFFSTLAGWRPNILWCRVSYLLNFFSFFFNVELHNFFGQGGNFNTP